MWESARQAVLVSGASSALGSRVAAVLLRDTPAAVVLPLGAGESRDEVLLRIAVHLVSFEGGAAPGPADLERIITLPLPAGGNMDWLVPALREFEVRQILHCADAALSAGAALSEDAACAAVALGKRLEVRRFVSLAVAGEAARARPGEAEVLASGLPCLLLRVPREIAASARALRDALRPVCDGLPGAAVIPFASSPAERRAARARSGSSGTRSNN
jgi:hypothetical protein